MYRLNRNLHRLSKQTNQYYNVSRSKQTSIYKFLSKYSTRNIHHTKKPNNSKLTTTSIASSSSSSSSTPSNGTKLPYTSPLTTTSYLSSYKHSKHNSSAAAAAQPSPPSIPTPTTSVSDNVSKYQIQPPRRTLKDCVPIKLGKGSYIDTMISDMKVDINQKDMVPMDGNTSFVLILSSLFLSLLI